MENKDIITGVLFMIFFIGMLLLRNSIVKDINKLNLKNRQDGKR